MEGERPLPACASTISSAFFQLRHSIAASIAFTDCPASMKWLIAASTCINVKIDRVS